MAGRSMGRVAGEHRMRTTSLEIEVMVKALLVLSTTIVCVSAAAPPASQPDAFFLRKGDRVVFLGDSITQQGGYAHGVENFVSAYHPDLEVSFFIGKNSGTTQYGIDQFKTAVLDHSPTVVTVSFGINDAALGSSLDDYLRNQRKLIEAIRAAGARPVLFTTSCLHENNAQGKRLISYGPDLLSNEKLGQWAEALKKLGAELNVPVIDMFHPLLRQDTLYGRHHAGETFITDGVHPREPGVTVLTMEILKAWRFVRF